jgi:RHS repeat-associated protein
MGRVVTYTYDAADRVLTETWQDLPPRVMEWEYDAAGQIVSMSDPDQVWSFEYWPRGLLRSVSNAGTPDAPLMELVYGTWDGTGWVEGYDGNANLVAVSDSAGGVTSYSYDARDHLVSLAQSGAGVDAKRVDFTVSGAGLTVLTERWSDLAGTVAVGSTVMAYDCGGCATRLSGLTHLGPTGDVLHDIQWTRDASLVVTAQQDAEGLHLASHDGARRLLAVDRPAGGVQPDENYVYDEGANRLASHLSASGVYTPSADGGGHRLVEDDVYLYAYDLNGNLTSRTHNGTGEQLLLEHDFRNRVTAATVLDSGGAVLHEASYQYTPSDVRVRVEEDGVVRHVLYDGQNPVLTFDDAGQVAVRRLYGRTVDRVWAEEAGGATRWILTDVLGTVRDHVADDGSPLAHFVYDSYGRQLDGPAPSADDTIRFTGREASPAHGLAYFRARWYDPWAGRFVGEDTIEPWAYVFAAASPWLFTDASGRVAALEYALELCDIVDLIMDTMSMANGLATVFEGVAKGLEGEPVDPDAILKALLEGLADFVAPDPPAPCIFGAFD